jgi:hypothetical protein
MAEKNKKSPLKAQIFVWEPIEGFNLDLKIFLMGTFSKTKKA